MANSVSSNNRPYIGRFAPSPTGRLHFGSLVAAVASFLDARAASGKWLLRIEDLDPPREQQGAALAIIESLTIHGLHWDGEIFWQSRRLALYQSVLNDCLAERIYPCACSRQRLAQLTAGYDGYCLQHPPAADQPVAYKMKVDDFSYRFIDGVQGEQHEHLQSPRDDFVLKRKDGLFAYQLAVVVDDWQQGVNRVVRGSDLLSCTARQACLFGALKAEIPHFSHVPVVQNAGGQKLSKQNLARELNNQQPVINLFAALDFLGQNPPQELIGESASGDVGALLNWAVDHWQLDKVPKTMGVVLEESE